MKNTILNGLTIVTLLLTVSCSNKSSNKNEYVKAIEEEAKVQYMDPDNFFAEAIIEFEKGNTETTVSEIIDAQDAMRKIIIEGDSVYASIIEFQVDELEDWKQTKMRWMEVGWGKIVVLISPD